MAVARILVVDDESGFRELCGDLLSDCGYEVEAALDGDKALERLSEASFQLVLTDINMPKMDGMTLLKNIKAKYPMVEVVLMTAFGGLQSALEALRFGAYDYITKPFTREALLATVGRCVEKQRLSVELKRVQEQLFEKERLAALGSVSGWLAHRMRNPLNVIQMCAQYLKSHFAATDEKHEVTLAIEDKVKILERMTHDFIGFSRTYQPRLQLEDLHELVNNVLSGIRARVDLQKVMIEKRYEEPLPLVPLDKELMEEVLGYLVDNALEAIQGPGSITLQARRTPGGIQLQISDTGPAIPNEVRRRFFEPFFTTKERGTGLGLAIARRVIESHGGEMTMKSGAPTTFQIVLPVSPVVPIKDGVKTP
ncbi:MAG: response regulator [Elusimicrobia bacterium]|nr:response regulator [Elusimicrobiota bacterium]